MTLLNELINEKIEEGQRDEQLNEMVMDKEYRAVLHSFRGPLTDIARHIDKLGQTDDAMAYKVRSEVANIINEARDIIFNLPE